jgi:hypothetical protein
MTTLEAKVRQRSELATIQAQLDSWIPGVYISCHSAESA